MAEIGSTLGARLHRIRTNNNISVRALADKVGVSASFIYQLEQGKVSASYSTLKSIAQALHTSVSMLAGEDPPADWFLVRQRDRRKIAKDSEGMSYELLAFTGMRSKKMQPVVWSLEPGKEDSSSLYSHDREEFLFVLEGEIEVTVCRRPYRLSAGDALYFMFERPEVIKNTGDQRAVGLLVVSPPGV